MFLKSEGPEFQQGTPVIQTPQGQEGSVPVPLNSLHKPDGLAGAVCMALPPTQCEGKCSCTATEQSRKRAKPRTVQAVPQVKPKA